MLAIHALAFRAAAGKSLGFTLCTLTSNVGGKGSLPGKAKARFHRLQHPENPTNPSLLRREGRTCALSQPLQILCAASPWRGGATAADRMLALIPITMRATSIPLAVLPFPSGEKPSLQSSEVAEVSSSALPLPKTKEEARALSLISLCRSVPSLFPTVSWGWGNSRALQHCPYLSGAALQDVMTAAEPFSQALQLDETQPGERGRGENPLCAYCWFCTLRLHMIQSLKHARKSCEQSQTWFPQFLAPLWDCTRFHHNPFPADCGGGRGWQEVVISCEMNDTKSSLTCQRQRKKGALIQ